MRFHLCLLAARSCNSMKIHSLLEVILFLSELNTYSHLCLLFFPKLSHLRRIGGSTADKHVTRMVDALLTTNFQLDFNKTGKDYALEGRPTSKISFMDIIEPLIRGELIEVEMYSIMIAM